MEVKAKESMEKQLTMAVANYEKVAEAKSQSGNIQVKEWNQQRDVLESKVYFVLFCYLYFSFLINPNYFPAITILILLKA
jgi:hypothetical protein